MSGNSSHSRTDYQQLRVVLLSGTLRLSGSTTWMLGLQGALRQLGCPVVHIVAGDRSDVTIPEGYTVYYTGRARRHPLIRLARLLQCHKLFPAWFERAADRVVSRKLGRSLRQHGWQGPLDLVIKDFTSETPSYFQGYKLVSVIHQLLSAGWQDPVLRRKAQPNFIFAAVSRTVASDARALGLDVPHILYNPLDVALVRERATALQVKEDFVLFVGSLSQGKGVYELLDAYARSPLRMPLWFIGRGKELAGLEKKVETLGLSERVRFLGFMNNPYPYIARACLLVLPSRRAVAGWAEAMGYVCLEAAVLDTPFLVSDYQAAEEFFEDEVRLAYEPEATFIDRLAERMGDAVVHPPSAGLRAGVLEHVAPDAVARSYLALI